MYKRSPRRAFTLVEVTVSLLIFVIAAISTAGSIVYARKTLELNKQRLAAMNLCRQQMEAIMNLETVPGGDRHVTLLHSPSPYQAVMSVEYYGIRPDGTVNWGAPKLNPTMDEPTYSRVTVRWTSTGVYHRNHEHSMQALITKGIL